jgi:aryl-alcohol dehydrogenase-like predicted oxidoreductase
MRHVTLGRSGLTVSRIGLGMMSFGDPAVLSWALDSDAAEPVVRRAVEAGVTLFDTADMYCDGASEEVTGALLRRLFTRRDEYVLATKVFYPTGPGPNDRGLSRAHILSAVDASLRRLGTDHVDLYQVHRWDPETPVEETMVALDDVVRAGKARYAGASLMRTWQFAAAQHAADLRGLGRFASMQTRLSLAYREEEREMLPYCAYEGIGVLAYSPLARGVLARQATTARAAAEGGDPTGDAAIVAAVRAVAAARGVPPARVALAWVLGRPAVTAPIVGATRPGQVDDAVAAVDLELTAEETDALEAPYRPRKPYGFE